MVNDVRAANDTLPDEPHYQIQVFINKSISNKQWI